MSPITFFRYWYYSVLIIFLSQIMLVRGDTTVPIPIPFYASILTRNSCLRVRDCWASREPHSNKEHLLIYHFYFLRLLRIMESSLWVQIRKMWVLGLDGKAVRGIEYHSSSCSKWQWYPPICVWSKINHRHTSFSFQMYELWCLEDLLHLATHHK
jgi:hypothetical protein